MDTTLRKQFDTPHAHAFPRSAVAITPALSAGRVWLAAHLLALAALGTVFAELPAIFPVWLCFTLLNALLYLVTRHLRARAPRRDLTMGFQRGVAAACGLAWGAGVVLLLPGATTAEAALLFAVVGTVAFLAIPLCAETRHDLPAFVLTLVLLAASALLHHERYITALPWLFASALGLLLLGAGYRQAHERLRTALRTLLGALPPSAIGYRAASDDAGLIAAAGVHTAAIDELRADHLRQERVLQALGVAVLACDVDGIIEQANPAAGTLLGEAPDALVGARLVSVVRLVREAAPGNYTPTLFEAVLRDGRPQHFDDTLRLRRADGSLLAVDGVMNAILDDSGTPAGILCTLFDVTVERQRHASLAWQATHDPLTGTINRDEFLRRLRRLLRHERVAGERAHALLCIDVDHFKHVNDTYGHAAGDAVLADLTAILRAQLRHADTLGRLGGDEFAALLYSCDVARATAIGRKLCGAVAAHDFLWQGLRLKLTLSIGVVAIDHTADSATDVLRAADGACYAAKRAGRNRVERRAAHWTPALQTPGFDLVKRVHAALRDHDFALCLQPLLPLAAATDGGARAWRLRATLATGDGAGLDERALAALLDRHQLAAALDRLVFDHALAQLKAGGTPIPGAGTPVLLPLSRQGLADGGLLEHLERHLRECPALAARVGFAVAFDRATDTRTLRHAMARLERHGCRLMLDDLALDATGYDALVHLPVAWTTLDAALLRQALVDGVAYECVLGLVRAARARGVTVVSPLSAYSTTATQFASLGIELAPGMVQVLVPARRAASRVA